MATIRVDSKQLLKRLENAETKSQVEIKMFVQEGAKKFENYAKLNRPWTDRTGHARQRLVGWVEMFSDKVRIHIGHGVDYGVYLELAHEKRYAILQPTVNALSKEVLEGFKELMRYI